MTIKDGSLKQKLLANSSSSTANTVPSDDEDESSDTDSNSGSVKKSEYSVMNIFSKINKTVAKARSPPSSPTLKQPKEPLLLTIPDSTSEGIPSPRSTLSTPKGRKSSSGDPLALKPVKSLPTTPESSKKISQFL